MATLDIIIRGVDHASGTFKKIDKNAGGLGKTLGTTLKAGALAGIAALGGLAVAGVKFIGAASDLEESLNKSKVVFGKFGTTIKDFAKTSAQSFGISRTAAFSYSSTLGTILKGSGLTQKASAGMSIELVKLAADMASFNNIPIGEALEKIRAGLVGESEPLRTVGVLLSEAAVKEKAYAMGLAETGAVLTDQQKVQARYALILEQTNDTQGDFTRTSGALANQQRILGAEWENIQAILGRALIPTVTRLAQTLTEFLAEHEEDIERFSQDLETLAEDVMPEVESAAVDMAEALALVKDVVVPTIGALKDLDEMLDGKLSRTFVNNLPGIREVRDALDLKHILDDSGESAKGLTEDFGKLGGPIGEVSTAFSLGGDAIGLFGKKAEEVKQPTDDLAGATDNAGIATHHWTENIRDSIAAADKIPGGFAPAIETIDDVREKADDARDALFKMFKEPTAEEQAAEVVLANYELQLAALHDQLVPLDEAQRVWLDSLNLTGREAEIAGLMTGGLTRADAEQYLLLKDNLIPEQQDHIDLLGKTKEAARLEAEAKVNTLSSQEEWRKKVNEGTGALLDLQTKAGELTAVGLPGLGMSVDDLKLQTHFAKEEARFYRDELNAIPAKVSTLLELTTQIQDIGEAVGGIFGGQSGREIGGYKYGGTVPGPVGMPQLAVVHGGERYLGAGNNGPMGNVTIQVFPREGQSEREIAAFVKREFTDLQRRGL